MHALLCMCIRRCVCEAAVRDPILLCQISAISLYIMVPNSLSSFMTTWRTSPAVRRSRFQTFVGISKLDDLISVLGTITFFSHVTMPSAASRGQTTMARARRPMIETGSRAWQIAVGNKKSNYFSSCSKQHPASNPNAQCAD